MTAKRIPSEETAVSPGPLDQIHSFAQKHARLIVFCSSLLVVLIVLLVANYYWNKSRVERGADAIAAAVASAELQSLRDEVRGLPEIHAHLLIRLGDLLYREGRLEEAHKAFTEFKALYPRHMQLSAVERALKRLIDDLGFVENLKAGMIRGYELFAHPALRSAHRNAVPWFGPPRPERPVLEIETTLQGDEKRRATIHIELSPEDAEKASAHLVEMAKKELLRGLTWEISENGEIIGTSPPAGQTPNADLPRQPSNLPIEAGAVIMVPGESGKDQAARFQIVLKDRPELFGRVTVVGYVVGAGLSDIKSIVASDKILSFRLRDLGAGRRPAPLPGHDHGH